MFLGQAPILVLKSEVIYILSCLEHGELNIRVIGCRNENKGGVFGERVFFQRVFSWLKKIYCLVIQNTLNL